MKPDLPQLVAKNGMATTDLGRNPRDRDRYCNNAIAAICL
jgi:hypothetical protein